MSTTFPLSLLDKGFQMTGQDFDVKVKDYHDLLTMVVEEDQDMVASLQRNMASAKVARGRMSLYETTVHNMIKGYLDHMFG
tara:strand:- start:92 stop:334 length:243 start_codon:yes stop_codon:yes gene_type:complete